MGELVMMGSKRMLDAVIPEEAKRVFNLDVQGGDTKAIWNPRDADEVSAARSTFDDLKDKGFRAFRVDGEGSKGEQVDNFDPEAGKLIMAPPMAGGAH